ncbi:MAG: CoA transferase [Pseudomonadales bacterium]|nr:CoA transferase [Pseudomonadales bacterium]
MSRPLEGIRILDFSHVLAGPFATRILGDMGADVVKINSAARAVGANKATHPFYIMWNRNKRALAVNMSSEEGRETCRKLCEKADIVIDNFSVGVLDRWGVGYESTRKVNPGVIYIQMSGMGEGGPWSKFVTYAPTIHAIAGLTALTGVPGRSDIGIGFSYNDHQAGLHGAVAILAALESRQNLGRGQRIDMSQFEVGVNFSGPSLLDYFVNNNSSEPTGNKLPYDIAAPHACYPCAGVSGDAVVDERWVAIACMTDEQWGAFKGVMGNPAWADESVFDSASGRVENVTRLDEGVTKYTQTLSPEDIMVACQKVGVPAGVVQNAEDLVERDPQLKQSGFLHTDEGEYGKFGVTYSDKLPFQFEATPCDIYERVHRVGEDNVAVLQDWLDMSEADVKQAEEAGTLK